MTEKKELHLWDIPRKSKIYCECSDGSKYIAFDKAAVNLIVKTK